MANDWILDVLADLKQFASRNDLTALAAQLDQAAAVAARDLASSEARAPALIGMHAAQARTIHRTIGCGEDA